MEILFGSKREDCIIIIMSWRMKNLGENSGLVSLTVGLGLIFTVVKSIRTTTVNIDYIKKNVKNGKPTTIIVKKYTHIWHFFY